MDYEDARKSGRMATFDPTPEPESTVPPTTDIWTTTSMPPSEAHVGFDRGFDDMDHHPGIGLGVGIGIGLSILILVAIGCCILGAKIHAYVS